MEGSTESLAGKIQEARAMKRTFPTWMSGLSWTAMQGLILGNYNSRDEVMVTTTNAEVKDLIRSYTLVLDRLQTSEGNVSSIVASSR